MKSIYKYLIAALCLPVLASCKSDNVQYDIQNPEDQMKLQVSSEEVVLSADNPDAEAITFTWNQPQDRGAGTVIRSYFRMDIADNNFESASDLIELEPGQTSLTLTADDLNDYLLGWGISAETPTKIEAEIIATVEGSDIYLKPELTKVQFVASGFAATSRPLFIDNQAMQYWSAEYLMDELVLGKKYQWYGYFEADKGVKFLYNLTTGLPSLNKGVDNNSIVRRTEAGDPDDLLTPPATGFYNVVVSTKTMTCEWQKVTPKYEKLWMVGNACPCGWDIDNPTPLAADENNPEVFVWQGHLNTGEIKMPLAAGAGWGCDYLMPVIHYTTQNGDDNVQFIKSGNPDYKWNITEAGEYLIAVNTHAMKIKFFKLD